MAKDGSLVPYPGFSMSAMNLDLPFGAQTSPSLTDLIHPPLAKHFHSILYLCINYTFKQVKYDVMNGRSLQFLDQFKRRK